MSVQIKKLFKHGGSQAINLPKEFVKNLIDGEVLVVEVSPREIVIRGKSQLDTIESEPYFSTFIKAIAMNAMKHPEKLRDLNEVWGAEWDELLKGVTADDETDE